MALNKSLALFDFDNTLSICDSFLPFIIFTAGPVKFLKGVLKLFLRRLSGPIERREAKQILAQATLKGLSLDRFKTSSDEFAKLFLSLAINSSQLAALNRHREKGDRLLIVSASPRLYLESLVNQFGVELIATELIVTDGIISGEIKGENCRGPEKVRRISEVLKISDYTSISAYGDSDGDKEMLEIANSPVYRGGRADLYAVRKFYSCLILYCRCLFFRRCISS